MINLSDLIDLSEEDKLIEMLLDTAVKNVYGNRKPLTELIAVSYTHLTLPTILLV